ncbi:MAG TPA: DUF1972 domain-containing protein, partial [Kineosporiaceae bacterium]|nr:DUF1972 domain-containing protein [Kineosporiaceae bacterium]
MKIAMIGTRGVPARYGGFETAVEEVGSRLVAKGHEVTVYCRGEDRSLEYLGMQRVRLPAVKHPVMETLSHTALSSLHLWRHRPDAAIVFNAANAPVLPLLKAARVPFAVHVDGLEWKRAKWGPRGRDYYLQCERLAVRWAHELIADAAGIQDYYVQRYDAKSVLIPYGAPILEDPPLHRLAELGLEPGGFHLVVARLEPENHVDVIVEGYLRRPRRFPLVVVGSVPYRSTHEAKVQRLAASSPQVRMLGGVWDQQQLDAMYTGCATYLHGHSVGGTNPSLLRAMGAAAATLAYDVNFNREVLGETGRFFADADGLDAVLVDAEAKPGALVERGRAAQLRAERDYRWDDIAAAY